MEYRDEEKIEDQQTGDASPQVQLAKDSKLNQNPIFNVQNRAESLFKKLVFLGNKNDGLTETPGTGSIQRTLLVTLIQSASASTARLTDGTGFTSTTDPAIAWDYSFDFLCIANLQTTISAAVDAFIGIVSTIAAVPDDATSVVRHIGFFFWDGSLYASCADGTTQTLTLISGVTLTNFNNYRFEFTTGKQVRFFINDVLVAVHSTNLPAGAGTSYSCFLYLGIEKQTSGDGNLIVGNNYSVFLTNFVPNL